MKGLQEKVVIVTGGAGGIGAALCKRFAEEKAAVAVFDLNAQAAQQVAAQIREAGGKASAYAVDITDNAGVNAAVAAVEQQLGPVDVLVNNAGWDFAARFVDTTPDLWQKIISINLVGPLNLHQAVVKSMAARGAGRVINIASDAGRVGSSGESVYSACKGGIIAFTKTIARECANHNIRVNTVCPGPTDTALLQSFGGDGEYGKKLYEGLKRAIPLKRLGKPEDVAGIVVFLSSPEAGFITGQTISVSGGLTMHG